MTGGNIRGKAFRTSILKDGPLAEGSKYPIFKESGPENHSGYDVLAPKTLKIGYLDPLG